LYSPDISAGISAAAADGGGRRRPAYWVTFKPPAD
jgi:hypothetical protein